MAWYHEARERLRSLLSGRRMDDEMAEEVGFHLEMETRRLEREGVPPDEARRRARRDFGGVARVEEEIRDERGTRWAADLGQDVHYALRTMRRRPGFTLVTALTLAIGIGATTALFGVIKAVLLTPLPYREPDRVAVLWSAWTGFDQTWLSYDEFEAFDAEVPAFENVALWNEGAVNIGGDEPERVRTAFVTHDLFGVLGVSPVVGRGFTPEEDRVDGPNVIVLGNALWQRRFSGDPGIIGREIDVNGRASVVVGIMPAGFKMPLDFGGAGTTEAWIPVQTDAEQNGGAPGPTFSPNGANHGYFGVARLRGGASVAQANRQIAAVIDRATADGIYPREIHMRSYAVPIVAQVTGGIRPALLITFGAVGFVLLIACANVAGLMLVRGEARRRELAVRIALGAGARRLSRQLLTETLVLAAAGGALGVALAAAGVALVRRAAPAGLPRFAEARLDPLVLFFALGIVMLAALLSGILPALQATGLTPATELKEGGRGSTIGIARLRWRRALVATEVALAVVLVTGAGLMLRSVSNLFAIDAGFDPHNVLTMRLFTPAVAYPDAAKVEAFQLELRRRIAELPGVRQVGAVRMLPLATEAGDWGLVVEGYTPPPNQGTPADWQVVTPGYFEAMGLRLAEGRFFDERDRMDAPLAMIINRRFVDLYFGGRDPIGKHVRVGGSPDSAFYTVVGIVDDVHHNGLTREVKAQFYAPIGQYGRAPGNVSRGMSLVVRTAGDPMALAPRVREIVRQMDPRLPVSEVRSMEQVLSGSIAEPRFAMGLLALFGVLALGLSAIGIFGIVAQVVAARAHEFGVRIALGALPRDVVRLSLRIGVAQTLVGLAAGVIGALVLTRILGGLLHGVEPTDPVTLAAVIAVTGAVALLASVGPARRAARTDPLSVLREE